MSAVVKTLPIPVEGRRGIVLRTRGETHGPINRLINATDVGRLTKPFVFLDLVESEDPFGKAGTGWHPHSGIATLTLVMAGRGRFFESTGNEGAMKAGDIEWMSAGSGVWHSGYALPPVKAFQLWVALPTERELTPAFSQHLSVDDIPTDGPARVLLGRSGGAVSPIDAPAGINYFVVQLKAGQRWTYQPPPGHLVGWIAVMDGAVRTPEPVGKGELAVFEHSDAALEFEAVGNARFVLGTAIPHPHELHLGYYSVHTSRSALIEGEGEIARIGRELRAKGVLG
ncbi:pirin family protein [Pseudomonas sp. SCB32]|uniref:pirin family protein n=1 Tax=Pseudomonas sp. SCB32 TaxID=2653853 RepID=UPI0012659940|nr:pirin family protein [Pseudomonas sp. SCB32]